MFGITFELTFAVLWSTCLSETGISELIVFFFFLDFLLDLLVGFYSLNYHKKSIEIDLEYLLYKVFNFLFTGGNWPATIALYLVSHLSISSKGVDDKRVTSVDGFYVETAICTALGFIWFIMARPKIRSLQRLAPAAWKVQ